MRIYLAYSRERMHVRARVYLIGEGDERTVTRNLSRILGSSALLPFLPAPFLSSSTFLVLVIEIYFDSRFAPRAIRSLARACTRHWPTTNFTERVEPDIARVIYLLIEPFLFFKRRARGCTPRGFYEAPSRHVTCAAAHSLGGYGVSRRLIRIRQVIASASSSDRLPPRIVRHPPSGSLEFEGRRWAVYVRIYVRSRAH